MYNRGLKFAESTCDLSYVIGGCGGVALLSIDVSRNNHKLHFGTSDERRFQFNMIWGAHTSLPLLQNWWWLDLSVSISLYLDADLNAMR